MARGVGKGRLLEGGDYFKYFCSQKKGGDFLREVINRGMAIIPGNMVCLAS